MCMHVCVYEQSYVHARTCVNIHVHACAYTVSMKYMYVFIKVHVNEYMYVNIDVHAHERTYMCEHLCACTYVHETYVHARMCVYIKFMYINTHVLNHSCACMCDQVGCSYSSWGVVVPH